MSDALSLPYHFPAGRCANVEASYAQRLQELGYELLKTPHSSLLTPHFPNHPQIINNGANYAYRRS